MKIKAVSGMMLTLLFVGMFAFAFNVQQVKAELGIIYIRADGSVDPPTANITSADNITYTFTDNINDSIVVERDSIVVDGAGYTLQGPGSGIGFNLTGINNVTIQNTLIKNFDMGVYLKGSSNNTVSGNNITNNDYGVKLSHSDDNTVSGNNITNNTWTGVYLDASSNNKFYHNNFIDNGVQASDTNPALNDWHHSDLLEGNYWSDYPGVDDGSGTGKHAFAGDGIGDTVIPWPSSDYDYYPLMNPWTEVCGVNITDIVTSHCGTPVDFGYTTWDSDAPLKVDVTVRNNGTARTNCTVNVYHQNDTTWVQIGTSETVIGLDPYNTATLTFSWDLAGLTQCASYNVKANVTTNCGVSDTHTTTIFIRLTGDADGMDAEVTILDVGTVCSVYALPLTDQQKATDYPYADLDGNCAVDILDIGTVCSCYAAEYQCP